MKSLSFLLATILLLNSCNTVESDKFEEPKQVDFSALLNSYQTNTEHEHQDYFGTILIKNVSEAQDFLEKFPTNNSNADSILGVNYDTYNVFGIFYGPRPTNSYFASIDSVVVDRGEKTIYVTKFGSASGDSVITHPGNFVTFSKADFVSPSSVKLNRICEAEPCHWHVSTVPD